MRIPEGLRAFVVGSRIVLRGPLDQWCGRGVIMLDRSFLVDPADDRLEAGSQASLERGRHFVFQPAGVVNGSPVYTAHPRQRMFSMKD